MADTDWGDEVVQTIIVPIGNGGVPVALRPLAAGLSEGIPPGVPDGFAVRFKNTTRAATSEDYIQSAHP